MADGLIAPTPLMRIVLKAMPACPSQPVRMWGIRRILGESMPTRGEISRDRGPAHAKIAEAFFFHGLQRIHIAQVDEHRFAQ